MISFFKKIGLLTFFVFSGFFIFSGTSTAEACEVIPNGTGFRTPQGTITGYDEENRPWIYFDVKTQNCEGVFMAVRFQHISSDIQRVLAYIPSASNPTSPGLLQAETAPGNDFTIPILLGEAGNVGSCQSSCYINAEVRAYEDFANLNVYTWELKHTVGSANSPWLSFECDGSCDVSWSFCPTSVQGQSTSTLLSYGAMCHLDQGVIPGFAIGGQSGGSSEMSTINHSIEALAPLPGMSTSPDVGEFLETLFTILIVIAGILAFIMIIVGAVTYMTSDAFSQKSDGKAFIVNALTGLVLALGAWVILNTINPNLASNLNISIPQVSLDGDTDLSPTVFTNGTTALTLPQDLVSSLNLYCPGSGGVSAVPQIIDSFVGKTTYRFGAKGGHLPAGQNYTQSNGNSAMCTNDSGEQQQCGNFCPGGSICLDCSGFVNHVRRCAGLTTFAGTASMVGNSQARPVSMNTLSSDGQSVTLEGASYQLQPGDLLVWNGHVVVYYGDGKIAESQGSTSGYIKNSNVKISSLKQSSYRSRITHIIKANP